MRRLDRHRLIRLVDNGQRVHQLPRDGNFVDRLKDAVAQLGFPLAAQKLRGGT